MEEEIKSKFYRLDPELQTLWQSNCAGEIFIIDKNKEEIRIGHFQGDSDLARYVAELHNSKVRDYRKGEFK